MVFGERDVKLSRSRLGGDHPRSLDLLQGHVAGDKLQICLLNGLAGLSELVLEREFHGDLDQAWSSGADDLSKIGIIHFPIHRCGSIELGMIEYVESLQPEFK